MNKKYVLISMAIVAITATLMYGGAVYNSYKDFNKLAVTSAVCVYKNDVCINCNPDGTCPHNLVTTAGLNWVVDKISLGNGTGTTTGIVVGNGTAEVAGDTSLSGQINGCNLAPAAATVAKLAGQANYSATYEWTAGAGCGAVVVNITALYNTSSPGASCGAGCVDFAEKSFTSVSLNSADRLNVTWFVWAVTG
jgi:hypothetical protein